MRKKGFWQILLVTVMLITLSACERSNALKITLTGSSTIAPLMMEFGRAFEKLHPHTRIDVQTGGSSRGIEDTRAGLADIGMVSRPLTNTEGDLIAHTVAYDGISLIINKTNPVSVLSDEQIIAIYQGKVNNWQTVGGPDQEITVVNKAEGRSTLELFLKYFKLQNKQIKADIIIGDNQQGIKTVAGNLWAIAYVSIGSAEYEEQHGSAIKLLGVGGKTASTKSVKQGYYPLSRPLNIVTKGAPQGLKKEFIDFAQSSQVVDLVNQQYFISIVTP